MFQHFLHGANRRGRQLDNPHTVRFVPHSPQRIAPPQLTRDAAHPAETSLMSDFSLGSLFFQENGYLLPRDTRDGEALSPKLSWSNPPIGVRSYVVLMENSEPGEPPLTHWLRYNIPGHLCSIPEGQPNCGLAGSNDFGHVGYEGPYPPIDQGDHHYRFVLLALDTPTLHLPTGATREEVEAAMAPYLLGRAELNCRYRRRHEHPAGAGC